MNTAAGKVHVKIAKMLLTAGADIELEEDASGWTPIFFAAAGGHVDVINLLLKCGAKLSNKFGVTPQTVAAEMGYAEAGRLFQDTMSSAGENENKKLEETVDKKSVSITSHYTRFLSTEIEFIK